MKRLKLSLIFILAFQMFMVKAIADDELSPITFTGFKEDFHPAIQRWEKYPASRPKVDGLWLPVLGECVERTEYLYENRR